MTYFLHQPLWEQVFYKLHQVHLHNGVMEKSHFTIDHTKDGWSLMCTQVVG